ncbi:MAG: hypothetical protein PHX38_10055 [Sulfuricella sp.]|nr:hypothetical protein [Sulfuricella sp.]
MKYFIYKIALVLVAGLVIVAAQAYGNIYANRLAAQALSETFTNNCIPDDGGKALVKNEAGKITCEKHQILSYGQAPRTGS